MQRLSERIAPLLPYLRRHARALTGSQETGDAYVAATLESIIAAPDEFPAGDSANCASTARFTRFGCHRPLRPMLRASPMTLRRRSPAGGWRV